MKPGRIRKLLRNSDLDKVLRKLAGKSKQNFNISDETGRVLWGDESASPGETAAVNLNGDKVATVSGTTNVRFAADIVSCFLKQESEKVELVNETLERYKEISLLYSLGEKLTANLDTDLISDMVITETTHQLQGDSVIIFILNESNGRLERLAGSGPASQTTQPLSIEQAIFESGQGEIINSLAEDSRAVEKEGLPASLISVPLQVHQKLIGLATLSSQQKVLYSSADLKLFTAITSQAANALENTLLHENKLKEQKIKDNLQRYVSSQLVEAIINEDSQLNLDPQRKNLTVLFSDIRNFTTSCENLPPEKIVEYLNRYFEDMVGIIFKNNGTINKFVGDMIVALFGAPHDLHESETSAVKSAIDMQTLLMNFPDEWIKENFTTGIGISHGEVVVGNIGSPEHMDYTAIGDAVNIASRLQAMARGGQILVTESIYLETKDNFEYRLFGDSVSLKGKEQVVKVYEVLYEGYLT